MPTGNTRFNVTGLMEIDTLFKSDTRDLLRKLKYLKKNKINCVEWEQIDDTRFSIDVDTYKDRMNDDVINGYIGDIEQLLGINDIAFSTIDRYKH